MHTCRRIIVSLSLLALLSACGVTAPRGNEGYADLDAP
jgi:cell division protein FtsB